MDLRDDTVTIEALEKQGQRPISHAQGLQMQAAIGAFSYVECSSLRQLNLKYIFEEAVRAHQHQSKEIRKKFCSLL